MSIKNCQKKKKKSNKGLKVFCNCLKCKGQNLVSISTCTRHQKKYSQSGNIQKSSTDEQESDKDDEDIEISKWESIKDEENDKNTEILDLESPNYEPIFQETIDKSDNSTSIELN